MNQESHVQLLRRQMAARKIDACIITGSDPHQSEITPQHWHVREWVTGFTGSAGMVVVTSEKAGLWTDFRYYIQAERELDSREITLFRADEPGVPSPAEWLARELPAGARAAVSAEECSVELYRRLRQQLKQRGLELQVCEDLTKPIWNDRPPLSRDAVWEVPERFTGESRKERLERVRSTLEQEYRCGYLMISALDDIAWTLNLRGSDVPYNPLFTAYLLITPDKAVLFCSREKLGNDCIDRLAPEVEVLPYEEAAEGAAARIPPGAQLLLSPEKTSMKLFGRLERHAAVTEADNPTTLLKAVKNSRELAGMREIHRFDGAAMAEFLCWFEKQADNSLPDEVGIADKLREFRRSRPAFIHESFRTIAAFGENGAICHYAAKEGACASLCGDGLLVLDSGGQYWGGTTDITRTLCIGTPSAAQRRDYTLVLKSHLALGRQIFPAGTRGYQLDAVARSVLWEHGMDYGHGTGHGIGFMLNVHEGPHSLSKRPIDVALVPGMVFSNEPGVYREGFHGVRIENLTAVRSLERAPEGGVFGEFLALDDLTLCPYERRLIDISLLSTVEQVQVDTYHARVYDELCRLLDEEPRRWLKNKTLPL
jgi:Xaa-Pro aminopeptidase